MDILKIEDTLPKAEKGIKLTKQALKEIRIIIAEYEFEKKQEEIYFFKNIKPKIYRQAHLLCQIVQYRRKTSQEEQ
ncbi:hypothetical protein [Gillisia sp. Hel_I_86]|uniref:hypothetical protein n=1 Tax=Gillisia sp. Hel_I_86 TaxID=1249981 RepID=UPI0021BDE7BD|nr:hypothetical protein [Gillisia sp. Hel_I_86]